MKKFSRIVVGVGAALSLSLVAGGAVGAASVRHQTDTRPYYLALGDSVAAGYQNQSVNTDRRCDNTGADLTGNEGYACLLFRRMSAVNRDLQFTSLALASSPGEDSCSFQGAANCSGVSNAFRIDAAPGDVAPYDITTDNQLANAEAFIETHNVTVISLGLGGNDFLPLLGLAQQTNCSAYPGYQTGETCIQYAESLIPTVGARLVSNLETIVGTLRTIDPTATFLLADQYNPLSGLPASALGPNGQAILALAIGALGPGTQTNPGFQSAVQALAAATHSVYVDEYDAFTNNGPVDTWITDSENIHPNALGYNILTNKYWATYIGATGGETISVMGPGKVKHGKPATFTITTLPGSSVTTTISYRKSGKAKSAKLSTTWDSLDTTDTQTWKAVAGAKNVTYQTCAVLGTGSLTKCSTGKFSVS